MAEEITRLLTSAKGIRDALQRLKPSHVAVAYIGNDWHRYIDANSLKQLIVSPTLGSNPKAIREVAEQIGWTNVYFLDNLHSKVYLEDGAVIFGSCNLSNNALGDESTGKLEVAMLSRDQSHVETLRRTFKKYLNDAKFGYPTKQDKLKRLSSLEALQFKAAKAGLLKDGASKASTLREFDWLDGQRLHIAWHMNDGVERQDFNKKVVRLARPGTKGLDLDDYYSDFLEFREEDNVRESDWILCWPASKKGIPGKGKIEWMYVSDIISGGAKNKQYTKMAVTIAGDSKPKEPFKLDAKAKALIRDMLQFGGPYEMLLAPVDQSDWSLPNPDGLPRKFFEKLKERYATD